MIHIGPDKVRTVYPLTVEDRHGKIRTIERDSPALTKGDIERRGMRLIKVGEPFKQEYCNLYF